MSDAAEPSKKERRPRNPAGTILRVTKTVKTKRGEKEVETLYARLRRRCADGIYRDKKRKIAREADAPAVWRELADEFESDRVKAIRAASPDGKTFADLVAYFERELLKPAVWRDEQVVSGYRSPVKPIRAKLKILNRHFGAKPLASISYDDLRRFRDDLIETPVVIKYKRRTLIPKEKRPKGSRKQYQTVWDEQKRPRKIATVNRIMAWARHLFNVAIRLGWLDVSPFKRGASLISLSSEAERMRILTRDEEARLIEKCSEPARAHLRSIVIFALETALRKSEILRCDWTDVDFEAGIIWAQGKNTKTLRPRIVPLTSRLRLELETLRLRQGQPTSGRIFDVADFKRSFQTACRLAELSDVRFHDLRHTATTRIAEAVADTGKAMKITGHTQVKTFLRYNNVDAEIAREAARAMDAQRAEQAAAAEKVPLQEPNVVSFQQFVEKKAANG